jgi:hypothetical protein
VKLGSSVGVVAYESVRIRCAVDGIKVYIVAEHCLVLFSNVAGVKLGLLRFRQAAIGQYNLMSVRVSMHACMHGTVAVRHRIDM